MNTISHSQQSKMEGYYQFQSKIYDYTRWSFLFGRDILIKQLPALRPGSTILEVGCGTGHNLRHLARKYPECKVLGLDAAMHMIKIAKTKLGAASNVELIHDLYGPNLRSIPSGLDMIIFSYSLTMINPGWEELIHQAYADLHNGGYIGVVDFDRSNYPWFKNHMANHHVRMENHLPPKLKSIFGVQHHRSKSAYFGLWNYFTFIGRKANGIYH